TAPDVGDIYLIGSMKDETRGTFQLAIMRRAHVRKSQKGLPTGRSGERIHCKEVRRVAIDVTDAQKPVFPQLLFHRDIPCEVAWCRVQLAWQTAGCQRVRSANIDRKSTRLNSSHVAISYAVFCLKKK